MTRRTPLRALALAALLALAPAGAARAQDGLPAIVMFVTYAVAPEDRAAFNTWIADFRAAVEAMINAGRLDPIDVCAYRSWRVLGPDAAGLNADYIFVFDPVVPVAQYLLHHWLALALGPEEGAARMAAFTRMAQMKGDILFAAPLDPRVDALPADPVCAQ
ncbi:MAG: hypothetical protein JJU42_09435 [Rhodobacteraceae bacterium]|nr:hypothetical protein [Paracoccaceae bacterium]